MSIYFPRPSDIPKLPNPVLAGPGLVDVSEISPDFLTSLPRESGCATFSSRKKLHVLVTNPSDVMEVLVRKSEDFLKGDQEIALSQAIGWGLIGLEGNSHKQAQKTAAPALSVAALDSYVSTIKQVAQKHLGGLEKQYEVPMRRFLRCLSQEAAERSLFSGPTTETDYSYQDHAFDLNAILFSSDLISSSSETALQMTRRYATARQNVMNHVSKLISTWQSNPRTGTFLIDYLSGDQEVDDHNFDSFHQQISVFLQAATETTATLTCWTIMLLSENPNYWEQLHQEVKAQGAIDSYDAVMNLHFLDAVINESLRLYPPAWLIPRIARVDTTVGGREILAGTRVVASPYVSHRMPEFFEQPNLFKPERWLVNSESTPRGVFFPFGMGNRICIGERYGKLTAKIILLTALEQGSYLKSDTDRLEVDNYSLLLNPSPEVEFGLEKLSYN